GGLIFVAPFAAYSWAGTLGQVALLRLVQGVGFGALTASATALAADLVPAARRGEGMGIFNAGSNAAQGFAPALGLGLYAAGGFGPVFLLGVAIALATLGCALPVRETRPRARPAAPEAR